MSDEIVDLQQSFDETLNKSDLADISVDIAEVSIDSLLKDGLLKDLPIVGTMYSLAKFGANIHDRLFLKKILSFLRELQNVNPAKRQKIIEEINSSKKYRVKVGEKLLYILDSCDDHVTAENVAKLFDAFLKSEIDYDDFLDASSIIKDINQSDLTYFLELEGTKFPVDEVGALIGTGLLYVEYEEVFVDVRDQDDYKVLRDGGNKYVTEIDGGKMWAYKTNTAQVIEDVFKDKS